jgi:hypothetical protein
MGLTDQALIILYSHKNLLTIQDVPIITALLVASEYTEQGAA